MGAKLPFRRSYLDDRGADANFASSANMRRVAAIRFDHAATLTDIAGGSVQILARSRGGATTKLHAVVDANGCRCGSASRAVRHTTTGSARRFWARCHRTRSYWRDRGYDADLIRAFVSERGVWADIPPRLTIWSSGSSTRSSTADAWPLGITSSLRTCIRLWLQVYESTS